MPPASTHRATRTAWLFVALTIATLAAYQPAWHGGMLWDDDAHLTSPALASWNGLWRIWTDTTASQQYYPVVGSAFWAMNALWGHDPLGYHVVNILLHATSALLLALLLRRWSLPGGTIAAVLFALHPVHVESVAWMSELKNTLSGVLYLLAAHAWLGFDAARRRTNYAAALALFVLALGSKSVTATLPAALLVVVWWRRGRIDWRRDVLPLLPFFGIGITVGLVTAWLEYAWVGAQGQTFDLTFVERVLLAGRALWFYLGKLLWPVELCFTYPRWTIDRSVAWQYLLPLAGVTALGALWALRRRSRGPLAAALLFAGTLVPALGFVNVYPFRYSYVADHFQYLASAGVLVAVAVGLAQLRERSWPRVPETALALLLGAPLCVLTFQQSRHYVNGETLYRRTLASNPESLLAHNNLAVLLLLGPADGWPEAAKHAEAAVAAGPRDAEAHNNLGLAWQRLGRLVDSEREHRHAIALEPRLAGAYHNLGLVLAAQGRFAEATPAYEQSLRLAPDAAIARRDFGLTLGQLGRSDEAIAQLQQAVQLAPTSPDLRLDLANAQQEHGNFAAAIATYREAMALRPDWGAAHFNLAIALSRAGQPQEAVAAFAEAERLLPDSVVVLFRYGQLLASQQRSTEAIVRFERALAMAEPQQAADIHNQLGMLQANQGRTDAARDHFEAALRLCPDFAAARQNLDRLPPR
jgi:tetratricopeptide (TPR) repeat protein